MGEGTGRQPFASLPARVLRWVARELGAAVGSAVTQPGGFSPGVAARVSTVSGSRAFVKAIATSRHAFTAGLHRSEIRAMTAIPPTSMLPRLYATYDDGDWVALLLEDIPGRQPNWHSPADVARVAAAIGQRTAVFTPTPWPNAPSLADAERVRTCWWARIDRDQAPAWVRGHQRDLAAAERGVGSTVSGATLCHRDVLANNILLTATDRVVFVDWAWASRGAAWIDTVHLAADVAAARSGIDVDDLLAQHPCTRDVDPALLTGYLINLAGSAYAKAYQAGPNPIPALQAFRRARAAALLDWLRHRTGW